MEEPAEEARRLRSLAHASGPDKSHAGARKNGNPLLHILEVTWKSPYQNTKSSKEERAGPFRRSDRRSCSQNPESFSGSANADMRRSLPRGGCGGGGDCVSRSGR